MERKSDLRIMYYNIYGYTKYFDKENQPYLYTGPIKLRQENEMKLIRRYTPDILGMQEYCTDFNTGMTPMLENSGYTRVDVWSEDVDKRGNKYNFTPIFYRADRLKTLDMGYVLYEGPNDVNSKSITWAVFEVRDSEKKFVCICTHFMYNDPKLPEGRPNAARVENAKRLLQVIEEIHSLKDGAYDGLPVMVGGDLNCKHGSDPFQVLCEADLKWLYDISKITNESRGLKGYAVYDERKGEYITCPVPGDNPRESIDHIFLMQGIKEKEQIEVLEYATITDREACISSDHCPRYADIIFK